MPLPSFVIAGERKCGTTALHHWMVHPDVYMLPRWDMNYFIEDEILGKLEWMDGEVDARRWEQTHSIEHYSGLFSAGEGRRAIGEKSADLFYWRPSHERMARYLPDARFIVMLRNPVNRAWSHYWDEVGKGREKESFERAIELEEERSSRSAWARDHLSYIYRGLYERTFESFFEHIDSSRTLVLTAEEMKRQPRQTLRKVYEFIEVDPELGLELAGTRHNRSSTQVPRRWTQTTHAIRPVVRVYDRVVDRLASYVPEEALRKYDLKHLAYLPFRRSASSIVMDADLRNRLSLIFAPHINSLEQLLGREFPEWKVRDMAAPAA